MPLSGDADYAKCQEENRLAWVAIKRITAAPCDSLCAVRAKLRVALDLLLREGSNWTDQEDMVVLEQAIAFLEQVA